jgi:hypothetical protein
MISAARLLERQDRRRPSFGLADGLQSRSNVLLKDGARLNVSIDHLRALLMTCKDFALDQLLAGYRRKAARQVNIGTAHRHSPRQIWEYVPTLFSWLRLARRSTSPHDRLVILACSKKAETTPIHRNEKPHPFHISDNRLAPEIHLNVIVVSTRNVPLPIREGGGRVSVQTRSRLARGVRRTLISSPCADHAVSA